MKIQNRQKSNSNSMNKDKISNKSNNNMNSLDISQTSQKKTKNQKKEKYQINCININDNKNNNNNKIPKINLVKNINNLNHEAEEELSIIESLWSDLGVEGDYQEEFINYILSISDEQEKMEMFFYEKNNLKKLREALIKLSVEITNRDNNLIKLKKYNSSLEKYIIDKKEKIDENIFNKIQETIKFLRLNAVNVINQIGKIREISSYNELKGKWDPDRANRAYLYKSNYLINMTENIKFINNSILFNFIETDNGIKKTDLFFSNCKYIITNDNKKLNIPISVELKKAIYKCKYIILQDNLLNKIKKDNIFFKQKAFSPKALKGSYNFFQKCGSDIYMNESDSKKYMTMFGYNKPNLSKTLYFLKKSLGKEYEKIFYHSKNPNLIANSTRVSNFRKNFEFFDKNFGLDKRNEILLCDNNNKNKIIIEHSGIKDIEEDKRFNCSNKNSKVIAEKINVNNEEKKNIVINNNNDTRNKEKIKRIRPNEKSDSKKGKRNIIKSEDIKSKNSDKIDYIIVDSKTQNKDIKDIKAIKNRKEEENNNNINKNKTNDNFEKKKKKKFK